MFGIGMPEMIMILVVALIVIGPKKLPELAKSLGRGLSEFKKATQEFKEKIDVGDDIDEVRETIDDIKSDVSQSFKSSIKQIEMKNKETSQNLSNKKISTAGNADDSNEKEAVPELQVSSGKESVTSENNSTKEIKEIKIN
ncbi:sec-independent protein translocase protein TatB [Candidatus Magnetomoraceae bacterium gMMP-15]